jgi:replicative DNA helicase
VQNARIAKNEGETYKSPFINKPIIEKEIIILKSNLGTDGVIKREFKKQTATFISKKKEELEIVFEN